MLLRCGLVGLPNVGKSTLFNAITETSNADAQNYPFCTIEPNIAIVPIVDHRLIKLKETANSAKIIFVALECRDIAGLVKGAHSGKGKGNAFLKNIEDVDLIIHLIRGFEDDNIMHVDESVNPDRDVETIELELLYADLERLEKMHSKSKIKSTAVSDAIEYAHKNLTLKGASIDSDALSQYKLHSLKPVIYALNVAEDQIQNPPKLKSCSPIILAVKLEDEISKLATEERKEFMESYNLSESGINKIMNAAYKTMNLITYFTIGPKEARGWTIPNGFTAPQAAGVIHSDLEKGFITGEIVNWEDFVQHGGWAGCKQKGLVRIEGKDYKVRDGDVCLWRSGI